MVEQLSLFEPEVQTADNTETLRNLAFLYTATEKGNNSGIRFMMSVEDATKFCSHPKTKGVLHGTRWAYFFTSVFNYMGASSAYGDYAHPKARISDNYIDLRGITEDNGKYDKIIDELGLKKINISEFPRYLEPLGIRILI